MPLTTYQSGDVLTASSLNANLVFAASAPTSRVFLVTQNGYGSSSTAIPRFTTAVVNSGSDITYADSASLGTTFTINTTGMYAMSMWICLQIGNDLDIAFSLNSTQLTTRPLSLTASTRLAMAFLHLAGKRNGCTDHHLWYIILFYGRRCH
jgi:hypothetical protein